MTPQKLAMWRRSLIDMVQKRLPLLQKRLLDALGKAVGAIGTDALWQKLHEFLFQYLPHDMGADFIYVDSKPPERLYDSLGTAERDAVHAILSKVGYLLSPYYNGLIVKSAPDGFYHLNDVEPDEFRDSEYHKAYYGKKGVADEGMFLIRVAHRTAIVLMVERVKKARAFSTTEIISLRAISHLIAEVVKTHFRLTGVPLASHESRNELLQTVKLFGSEFLTSRERDVAMLILRGHSSKSAARELGISPETERVHRRRLYSRLSISSHSELFWLFFKSVENFDPSLGVDPLQSYLNGKNSDKKG
jgi:DNA-binding CsgD family transcriptional regulator